MVHSKIKTQPGMLFFAIAAIASLSLGVATFLDQKFNADFYLACGICIAAVVLFIGLIYHALTLRKGKTSDGIRDAIACTFLAVYLILVVYGVFFANAPAGTQLFPQTTDLLTSFTSVTAVVVGFYFATGSVDKFIERRKTSDSDKKLQNEADGTEKVIDGKSGSANIGPPPSNDDADAEDDKPKKHNKR